MNPKGSIGPSDFSSDFLDADMSVRAQVFRERLIEEFHVEEDLGFDAKSAPKYSTADLFSSSEPQLFKKFLVKTPHQLIKFKIFKRSQDESARLHLRDKRMIRVKNLNSLPIGVWAKWISNHSWFTGCVFTLIILNAVVQGVESALSEQEFPMFFSFMDILDDITIVIFSLEIILKWLDSFAKFWLDGWNVFDFAVTALSAIPRLIEMFVGQSSSSSSSGSNGGGGGFTAVVSQLRLFRTLRILKMIARLSSLRVVISTVIEALQALGFVLFLLLLLTYMFAIFAVNLFSPYTTSTVQGLVYQSKFKDLPSAFITLFQLLTLDQWYVLQDDIQRVVSPVLVVIFFLVWVWIGAFVFRNVFVGVIVKKFEEMNATAHRIISAKKRAIEHDRNINLLNKELAQLKKETGDNPEGGEGEEDEKAQLPNFENPTNPDVLANPDNMENWENIVRQTLASLDVKKTEHLWPRDTLFRYLQVMEKLQNNVKEYQDLNYLCSIALHNLYDKRRL